MEWLPNGVVPCLRRAGDVAVAVRLFRNNENRAAPQPVGVSRVLRSR